MTKGSIHRRQVLAWSGSAVLACGLPLRMEKAWAAEPSHGLSAYGDLKYTPGFEHFSYVSPDAPKGGELYIGAVPPKYNQNPQTFNTFNTFILEGDAAPLMDMCFDTLMVRAFDEPDAIYGLVAESVEWSETGNTCIFNLRPEARFHDMTPITSEDVAFSFNLLKDKGHPEIVHATRELVRAEVLGPHQVAIHMSSNHSRQLPIFIAGNLPIFSRQYYTTYDFSQPALAPPLSSGPYKVGKYGLGKYIEYERVADYWAKDLPVMRGHNNFDRIRVHFFRDSEKWFESFKKGEVTFFEERNSKRWAKEYDFPAVKDGRIVCARIADSLPPGAQGWFINTRRKKFSDVRIRQAIGLAFDFEWSNKSLFYGLYSRTQSYFQNSPMMAKGKPSKEELALLEPYRAQVPETVFGDAIVQPVSNGLGSDRKLLEKAAKLLKDAGCIRKGDILLTPDGEPFEFEMLGGSFSFERIVLPYIKNLEYLGIKAFFHVIDPLHFKERTSRFDFDVVHRKLSMPLLLNVSSRNLWTSEAASKPGSRNFSGIADPVVDALLEKALAAKTRKEMEIAARALDRVLRAGHYWVPHWHKPVHNLAMWDQFAHADTLPEYGFPFQTTWWSTKR